MEDKEKTIQILAETIDRLNKTIESQNRLIEDLKNRLETIQNEYSPSIMTVGVLIEKLNNTKTRSGKVRYEALSKHIMPYLTNNSYDEYDFNDVIPTFKEIPSLERPVSRDMIDDMVNVIKSKRRVSESSHKSYLLMLKRIFSESKDMSEYINDYIVSLNVKSPSNISLTEEEIELFWNVEPFDVTEEMVKKLFLIQCYTAMRYSDIFRLKDSMMNNNDNVISYISKKTGKVVEVPVPSKIIEMIKEVRSFDKYNIESTLKTTMNEILPTLGCRAGINNQVFIRRANVLMKGPKYQFIKTHTGRRTAITRWANMGIPEAELKSMAGHSDIRTTNRYITASISNKTKKILTDDIYETGIVD